MFSPGGCVQETATVFMNDLADTYPEGSALHGAESSNAAAALDSEEDEDEGDEAEVQRLDDDSSDSDDSDSSTGDVAGDPKRQETGATDSIVASSSDTSKKGDEPPEVSQPSEASKGAKAAKTAKTTPAKGAKATKTTPARTPVAKPAKTTPVTTPVASVQSTMGGGAGTRSHKKNGATIAEMIASSSGTDTVVDEVSETEAHKAAKQVKAPGTSGTVAAYPTLSLSKALPVGKDDEYEQEKRNRG
jgi:hypothetical protein